MHRMIMQCDICSKDVEQLFLVKTCLLDVNFTDSKVGLKVEVCRDCNDNVNVQVKEWIKAHRIS